MLLVTTALSGLMAGVIQTVPTSAPPPQAPAQQAQPQTPPQDAPAPAATGDSSSFDLGTVSVSGSRPRGAVDTDIAPDLSLSAEEIQAYGAGDIAELLAYLEPVTRSTRGRGDNQPVLLVNGRRTTGFREIQGIPTEAIERVDILPEEAALQFGYRADQRVVNFILKSNFRSVSGQVQSRQPTEGGRTSTEVGGNVLRISAGERMSLDVEYERATPLFESERDIVRDPGSTPFDLIGNISGSPFDTEIDSALSARVGSTARIAPVPASGAPTIANFASVFGDPRSGDLSAYRTLLSASEQSSARGTYKRDINGTTQGTINVALEDTSTESFNGLPGLVLNLRDGNPFSPFADDVLVYRYLDAPASLTRQSDTLTGNVGIVLDGFLGEAWRWTVTGAYDRIESDTTTGRGFSATPFQTRLTANDAGANPFGVLSPVDFTALPIDTANSVSESLAAELVLNGDVFELPAGDVSSTFRFGADTRSLDSTSSRAGVFTARSQSRDRLNAQASFDLPITGSGVLEQLGDLSANFNVGYEDLSDFGGLSTLGFGVNWSPVDPLSFLVSYTDEQGAPSISQLNDPFLSTPNVPVFDFRTNRTVLVTRINGGNPNLNSDNRKVFKAGVTLRPLKEGDLTLNSTWTRSTTDDSINGFPAITPDLEAALPARFVREAGNLVSFDARPLNFASAERQDIRTGFNFSKAFGTPTAPTLGAFGRPGASPAGAATGGPAVTRAPGAGGGPDRGPRAGGAGGGGQFMRWGGGGGGRGGGMMPGQGRFNVSIYHTYRIQDEIVITDGLPVLDLLDGAATGGRGGSSRHEIQAQGGVFKNGMGAFVNANWRSSTRIDGGTGPDLEFADQATVNLNVFIDLASRTSWIARYPFLKGTRINLGIQNLFDSEPEVTSSAGGTPLNYQPDFLDPQGRTVSLTLRKILF